MKNKKPVLRKLSSIFRPNEVYYNYDHWNNMTIEGVEYLAVSKSKPINSTGTVHVQYVKKDSLKVVEKL